MWDQEWLVRFEGTDPRAPERSTATVGDLDPASANAVEPGVGAGSSQLDALRALLRLSTARFGTIDELFAAHLDLGCRLLELPTGIVAEIDGPRYLVRAARTPLALLDAGLTYDLTDTFCDATVRLRQTVAIADARADAVLASKFVAQILEQVAYLGVPIEVGGRVWGSLAFAGSDPIPGGFTAEAIEVVEALARSLSRGLADATQQPEVPAPPPAPTPAHALAAGASDGLWDWDLRANRLYLSPRWKAMLGWEAGEIGDDPAEWLRRVHPDDVDGLRADLRAHLDGLTPRFDNEHRLLHRDGIYRWMHCRGQAERDSEGPAYRIAGVQTDITDRKVAEEQLLLDAFHDALTGLPNRSQFLDRLRRAISRSQSEPYRYAVLFVDLDRFKVINDSLGHMVGDQLLIAMARRFEACLRPHDTVARLGGDEFTILLDDIRDPDDAVRVANRIQRELTVPFELSAHEIYTSASIGIALGGPNYTRPDDVLRDADTAMYRAKNQGKACHAVFDAAMHEHAVALLRLETDLRRALDRGELALHYQPIVALATGQVAGFEALVRWHHPQRGLVSPADFVPVAEETGLILPIGDWVIEEACRQLGAWQQQVIGDLGLAMSVNLSSKQFAQAGIVDRIRCALAENRIEPSRLRLEITETVLMENPEMAAALLSQLQALHVRLTLDDFGTGYSSLSYLHRFPIDTLKIDRYFISRHDPADRESEIVRTIIGLARNLGLHLVAEGIETEAQLTSLRNLGCDYGQGYLFDRPLLAEEAAARIGVHYAICRR